MLRKVEKTQSNPMGLSIYDIYTSPIAKDPWANIGQNLTFAKIEADPIEDAFHRVFAELGPTPAGPRSARALFDAGVVAASRIEPVQLSIHEQLARYAEEAVKLERARILVALEKIAPMDQPYTRRDWALEQRGEKSMYAKVLKAIGGAAKEDKA